MAPNILHHLALAQVPCPISWKILKTFPHYTLYTSNPVCFTCWKQLWTMGSILLPPKYVTSPSCRGIWITSCSKIPSCRWSHISVGPATALKRSARRKGKRLTSICPQCSLMSLVMGIEQWRLKNIYHKDMNQLVTWMLTTLIFCVSVIRGLVNHMLLKTTSCCMSIHLKDQ